MYEGNALPLRPEARRFVDESNSGRAAAVEGGIEVVDGETDVVDARAARGHEFADWRGGILRFEELNQRIARRQTLDPGPVGVVESNVLQLQDIPIEREDRIEVAHGDADVRDGSSPLGWLGHAPNLRSMQVAGPRPAFISGEQHMSNALAVTDSNFEQEVEQASGLTIVDFWATWCGPCRMIAPILDQIAVEHAGKVKITKLDVDANIKTASRFNVRSIPMLLFFKDGKVVDQIVGAVPKMHIEQKLQQHAA
jgi:thioredoxin 1